MGGSLLQLYMFYIRGQCQSNVSESFRADFLQRLALIAEKYLFIHPLISVSVFSLV